VLLQIIEIVILLGKQELVLRGHDESTSSINLENFREMLNLLTKQNT
jgi:hypothetical protein